MLEEKESLIEIISFFGLESDGAGSGEIVSLELEDGVSETREDAIVAVSGVDDGISRSSIAKEKFSFSFDIGSNISGGPLDSILAL